MTLTLHRIKTFAGWQVKQSFPGIYVWRDPFGATYLVDHTGTRRLPRSGALSAPVGRVKTWLTHVMLDWAA